MRAHYSSFTTLYVILWSTYYIFIQSTLQILNTFGPNCVTDMQIKWELFALKPNRTSFCQLLKTQVLIIKANT